MRLVRTATVHAEIGREEAVQPGALLRREGRVLGMICGMGEIAFMPPAPEFGRALGQLTQSGDLVAAAEFEE